MLERKVGYKIKVGGETAIFNETKELQNDVKIGGIASDQPLT